MEFYLQLLPLQASKCVNFYKKKYDDLKFVM